jgi:uncharacterized protein YndB with AHSA1/START domain
MTTVTNSYRVWVKAPTEAVFAYVSDLTRHPEWSGARLQIVAVSSDSIAVGKQYISHGDVANQKDRLNQLHVTEYQSPTRFAFIARDPDFGDVPHIFTFTPKDGGTLLERTVTVTLSPARAFLFRTLIRPLLAKPLMDKALAKLKAKLEGQPS